MLVRVLEDDATVGHASAQGVHHTRGDVCRFDVEVAQRTQIDQQQKEHAAVVGNIVDLAPRETQMRQRARHADADGLQVFEAEVADVIHRQRR